MDMLMSLLLTFEADVFTRWKDAHRTVIESTEWETDAHLSTMDLSDMLIVFDEHMKSLEKEKGDAAKEAEKNRRRAERKRREAFKLRLQGLIRNGTLTARTPWPVIYDVVKTDEGFTDLIGQPGSSPLDMYFDAIEELDDKLKARTVAIQKTLETGAEGWKMTEATTFVEFRQKLKEASQKSGETALVDKDLAELKLVYEEVSRPRCEARGHDADFCSTAAHFRRGQGAKGRASQDRAQAASHWR